MPPKRQLKATIEEEPQIAKEAPHEEEASESGSEPEEPTKPQKPLGKKTPEQRRDERNARAREWYHRKKLEEASLRKAVVEAEINEPVCRGRRSAQIELNGALHHFLSQEQGKRKKLKSRLGQLESDMSTMAEMLRQAFRARSPSPPPTPKAPTPEPEEEPPQPVVMRESSPARHSSPRAKREARMERYL
jgi:hypothetical protein